MKEAAEDPALHRHGLPRTRRDGWLRENQIQLRLYHRDPLLGRGSNLRDLAVGVARERLPLAHECGVDARLHLPFELLLQFGAKVLEPLRQRFFVDVFLDHRRALLQFSAFGCQIETRGIELRFQRRPLVVVGSLQFGAARLQTFRVLRSKPLRRDPLAVRTRPRLAFGSVARTADRFGSRFLD